MAVSIILSVVMVLGLILSTVSCLLALMFLGNFNFSNNWHLFVFTYTCAAPVASIIGMVGHYYVPKGVVGCVSLLAVFAPIAIPWIWSLEGSQGLIH
ncbi:hypothetical protein [Luteolibacter sp. AS25]|uniref:hypothetical protein n=1 Tax=Luteolibacter sp. AS25 TaxID=3135776 RepID=UPI00398B9137